MWGARLSAPSTCLLQLLFITPTLRNALEPQGLPSGEIVRPRGGIRFRAWVPLVQARAEMGSHT